MDGQVGRTLVIQCITCLREIRQKECPPTYMPIAPRADLSNGDEFCGVEVSP